MTPRSEHPRPDMMRESYICLNGPWEFETDYSRSGRERGMYRSGEFTKTINVPFCMESVLSGVGITDFCECVWYRKKIEIPELSGKRALLHFGAVDYKADVWINGEYAGGHTGGYTPFCVDITKLVTTGVNTVVLSAEDCMRLHRQCRGKQSEEHFSHGCDYTRTTGIWQTVWMEYVPEVYIHSYKITPDPENGAAHLEVRMSGHAPGLKLTASASFDGKEICRITGVFSGDVLRLTIPVENPVLWEPGKGNLYDFELSAGGDLVRGYFGMRSVGLTDKAILINGKPVFQRLVLDQGFYPDGIYTAPSDEALRRDIELSMEAGFNGARLHQKIFEPRFLYHADRMGYLVWGEHGSWGLQFSSEEDFYRFIPEWGECVDRDFSHPSIIGWCPLNETWDSANTEIVAAIWREAKRLDPTRPVIDTSGYIHVETDVYDIHCYNQNPSEFAESLKVLPFSPHKKNPLISGIPFFVSEYGGTWWNQALAESGAEGWGYGARPKDIEEVYARIEGLTLTMLENPGICAFCYTQLTDIEQEQNGIYYYDRKPKFETARLRKIFGAKAAIEGK